MDKRAFAAMPRPLADGRHKEMALLAPVHYLVAAERGEIAGKDTLTLNFFRCEGKEPVPAFRTFCQMEDYISQDLSVEKAKWRTGAVNYLTGSLYRRQDIMPVSLEDRETIFCFLRDFWERQGIIGKPEEDAPVEAAIDAYQMEIKGRRLRKKHEEEIAKIDSQMEKFGGIPGDYADFVKGTVFDEDNYIFYSKRKGQAYCTRCGHGFQVMADGALRHEVLPIWNDRDKAKHNATVVCPFCGRPMQCKSEGRGRGKLFAVRWSVLVQKHGEEVMVRYFCHTKDFKKDYRLPEIKSSEMYRTIHTAEKSMDFEWNTFKNTQKVRWCFIRNITYGFCMPPETLVPRNARLYRANLSESVAGTCMKYSAVDIYVDKLVGNGYFLNSPWAIDWYFNTYRKKPYLEQLLKVGFFKIAQAVLDGDTTLECKGGRTVLETLGINRRQFHMLREIGDPTARDVMVLRYAGDISEEDFHTVRQSIAYREYLDMRRYTTVYRVKKYLQAQGILMEMDYFDYIGWLEKMGYDMRNTFHLYPKNFEAAHREKSLEYLRFREAKKHEDEERFRMLMEKLRPGTADMDALNLRMDGLFIRLPETLEELKQEGSALHHCVGTYAERVAAGSTMIFFIRREEEPEKPFYTLEWKGKVIQCRGRNNCKMTPEVRAFTEVFQEKMVKYGNRLRTGKKAG